MNIYIFENIYIFKEYLLSWEMCDMSSEISKTRKVCMYTYTHTLTHTHVCKYLEVLSQNNKSDFSFLWFSGIMVDFYFLYIFS